jgi:hypothetical protein
MLQSDRIRAIGGRVPRFGVTFEPRQVLPWVWQEVKGEGMSANEAVYTGVIESTVGPDGRQ